jgi:hypothetical protein
VEIKLENGIKTTNHCMLRDVQLDYLVDTREAGTRCVSRLRALTTSRKSWA